MATQGVGDGDEENAQEGRGQAQGQDIVAEQGHEGRLQIMVTGFVAVGFGKVDGVLAFEDGAIDEPVGDFVVFQAGGRDVVEAD